LSVKIKEVEIVRSKKILEVAKLKLNGEEVEGVTGIQLKNSVPGGTELTIKLDMEGVSVKTIWL
jgi:hypothetical protein